MFQRNHSEDPVKKALDRRILLQNPAFQELFIDILTILKWRGTLETAEDIARHNAAEEILGFLGGHNKATGWTKEQVAAQFQAAIGEYPSSESKGQETDVRR